jgi:Spy/CpxP family protein refolding chaperone
MLRKLTLTLAAAAALGAAALAPNTASAAHWHHGWFGFGPHYGPLYSSCVVRQWVRTPWGPRLRWVNICY